jgi:hypothetical protein
VTEKLQCKGPTHPYIVSEQEKIGSKAVYEKTAGKLPAQDISSHKFKKVNTKQMISTMLEHFLKLS